MKPLFSITAAALAFCLLPPTQASNPLPAMGASADGTSVSGLSSGAFMAVQYQVAYSASVSGAGVVAGGPYYCAAGLLLTYSGICMGLVPFVSPNADLMVRAAQFFAASGLIDPISNLQKDRVYVFSGTMDTVVHQSAVNATAAFFKGVGVPKENLLYVKTVPSGHALLTPAFGNHCGANEAPFISRCTVQKKKYDQAGAIFSHIYGNIKPPATARTGQLLTFRQSEFADPSSSMSEDAFVYVPASCAKAGSCKVHVAFHGCKQSADVVGDDFYGKSSYNDWADSNNIIMLYPQVRASLPFNENGCWDWIGYTGPNYAYKTGPQMKAVRAMIERLTSAPPPAPAPGAVAIAQ